VVAKRKENAPLHVAFSEEPTFRNCTMIGKITRGSSAGGAMEYCEKGKDDEKAELIDTNMEGNTAKEFTRQFQECQRMSKSKIKNNVKHFILAFSPDDFPNGTDPDKLKEITNDYLTGMGYDNNQYAAYLHKDTAHTHLHIVCNQINMDLKATNDFKEYFKSRDVCREIERKHGLTVTKQKATKPFDMDKGNFNHRSKTEMEARQRLQAKGQTTIKQSIHKAIHNALLNTSGHESFVRYLENEQIKVHLNKARNGYTFEKDGYKFKGSSINRTLSFANIDKRLNNNQKTFDDFLSRCKDKAYQGENPIYQFQGKNFEIDFNLYFQLENRKDICIRLTDLKDNRLNFIQTDEYGSSITIKSVKEKTISVNKTVTPQIQPSQPTQANTPIRGVSGGFAPRRSQDEDERDIYERKKKGRSM
jgi:hypothetical protein